MAAEKAASSQVRNPCPNCGCRTFDYLDGRWFCAQCSRERDEVCTRVHVVPDGVPCPEHGTARPTRVPCGCDLPMECCAGCGDSESRWECSHVHVCPGGGWL